MPGPAPKPTALKKLEGNPGKRTLPFNEPRPAASMPACPAFIKGAARKEWQRLAPELYQLGLLTRIDRAALASYCLNYGRWEDAEKRLAKLARKSTDKMAYLYRTTNGNLILNPLLTVSKQAMELMHKFLVEFGMTPASRSRIVIEKYKEEDPLDEILDNAARQN
jgi:P27 family predicted phage terminase small subunit